MQTITSKTDFTIHGVQWMDTDDGYAYSYTLKLHGKKIAEVHQGGYGGPTDVRYTDKAIEAHVRAWCAAQPITVDDTLVLDGKPFEFQMDEEILADELFGDWDDARQRKNFINGIKRKAKDHTLFRLKADGAGDNDYSYRSLKLVGERAVQWLRDKYGEQLGAIFNPETAAWEA